MTTITSVRSAPRGDSRQGFTAIGNGSSGWLPRALAMLLSGVVVQCGGDGNGSGANGPRSSGSGGGMSVSTAGTTSIGTTKSGGANSLGGSTSTANGGTSTAVGAGGFNSTSSTTSGGVASTGGMSNVPATGGATTSGGTASNGGKASTGGTNGNGGKSSSGGATTSGGAMSNGGKTSAGGAFSAGGATVASGGSSAGGVSGVASGGATSSGTFTLTSPGWTNQNGCGPTNKTVCAALPTEITRFGAGTSPELHWTGAPAGTKSFVVLLQDLNNGTAHWVLWNIQPTITTLAANVDQTTATPTVPAGSQQCGKGTDAATTNGYYGPGASCNVYEFIVYALGISTFSPTNATDQESVRTQLQALGASLLGSASLRGRTNQGC